MEVVDVSEVPEAIDVLASWHFAEWGSLYPNESQEDFKEELRKCLECGAVPATFVAMENNELLGSISVLARDMDIEEPWGPWLANFYVQPRYRSEGVGKRLISALLAHCAAHGIPGLYLFTPSTRAYYERLGWEAIRSTEYHGQSVTIMLKKL